MKHALVLFALCGCSHVTPIEQDLLNCGTQAVEAQIPNLVPQVTAILNSASVNWQSALDELLTTAGSAAICAVQVAVTALENGGASTMNANGQVTPPAQHAVAIARGEAWLTLHVY